MLGYEINYVDEVIIKNKTSIREICVPFNFSKSAYVGLMYAAEFAKMIGADITILHCFQSTALEFGSASDVEYSTTAYERKIEILKKVPALSLVNTSFLIEHSFMPEMLKELDQDGKIDMVILGSQISTEREKFLGTNASSLVNSIDVPLLIIPDDAKHTSIKNIMFAADFKEFESLESIDILKKFANISGAKLHIVHVIDHPVNPNQSVVLKKLKEIFADIDHQFYDFNHPNVHNGLKEIARLNKMDLLVMTPRKHGFIETIYKKSETKKMAMDTKLPLLIFQE
ncbi:MAG: universal stress protein [Bacteroidetes bacterium]|nr:universal stress protein [Bacteroidota bacterium]MDA1119649.1 universal stress protein [Bacteroidota bacterium]